MDDQTAAYRALGGVGTPPQSLQEQLCKMKARLQVVRSWMHPVDWDALVRAHPPAADWFDNDGIPK